MGAGVEPVADAAEALVRSLFAALLRRPPTAPELAVWTRHARAETPAELVRRFGESPICARTRGVPSFWPAGHYYSPVVDPTSVHGYVMKHRAAGLDGLAGIATDLPAMEALWARHTAALGALDLPRARDPDRRFMLEGSPFPAGDAASLFLMMREHRPKRILEVGSGFSTAAALDFAERLALDPFTMRCVEPYPDLLKSLLRDGDAARVELIEKPVQDVSAEEGVARLAPGDFLLIDSTHVLKTGSDVHHEIFTWLPRVPAGVLVHFHDCPFPFEYPDLWIMGRNYSWNEAYAVRAFLMFNQSFRIEFWASLLRTRLGRALGEASPCHAENVGSSLWLRRVG